VRAADARRRPHLIKQSSRRPFVIGFTMPLFSSVSALRYLGLEPRRASAARASSPQRQLFRQAEAAGSCRGNLEFVSSQRGCRAAKKFSGRTMREIADERETNWPTRMRAGDWTSSAELIEAVVAKPEVDSARYRPERGDWQLKKSSHAVWGLSGWNEVWRHPSSAD
jgi:hypothetical protein